MTIYSFNYLVTYTYFYILKFLFYDYNISAILYIFKIMHRAFIYFKYYSLIIGLLYFVITTLDWYQTIKIIITNSNYNKVLVIDHNSNLNRL